MIHIWKYWDAKGRAVDFHSNGQRYNEAKIKRFIAEEQKAGRLDEDSLNLSIATDFGKNIRKRR